MEAGRSADYTYDALHRLKTAVTTGSPQFPAWGLRWDYDRYSNRTAQAVTAGSGVPSNSVNIDPLTNRITGAPYSYDASGNMTNDGLNALTYDGESRVVTNTQTGVTTNYSYDGNGLRVRKTVGGTVTDYFYSGAEVIAEKQGSAWTDYVFFGNRIAQQTGSTHSTATYLHTDHLRSTRVCTDASGASNGRCDYEPFGEFQDVTACSALPTLYRFAGMAWDSEISGHGFYHTWFRQYDPAQGRWMSVDPLPGTSDAPQSLNRYAYVLDDPVNLVDPLGLSCYRIILKNARK